MPQRKFIIVGALILGAVSYLMFSGISGSMVYDYTVPEVMAQSGDVAGRGIRISGHVSPGSIRRDAAESQVEFAVLDEASSQTLPVFYQGIIPDTFRDGAEVVVEGEYNPDQAFQPRCCSPSAPPSMKPRPQNTLRRFPSQDND